MTKRYSLFSFIITRSQRAFLFYLVLPLLALSGIAINVALEQARTFQDQRLRDDLELIGRAIRLPLSDALMNNDIARVQAHLDAVFDIGRVYGASVYDTGGDLVAAAGVTERDLSESLLAEQLVLTGEQQDSYRQVAGRDVYSQFIPVHDRAGRLIGFMQLNRRAEDFDRSFAQLERIAWISWSIVAVALLTILAVGFYRTRQQQQQELNERLREHQKMAAVGQLARGVAHELGAPLTVIAGRAKRLQTSHPDPESQRQLTAIRGQVERLTGLVQQLLDFSRTPISDRQPIAIRKLIEQAKSAVMHEQSEADPVLIQFHADGEDIQLQCDATRLELALVNILRNAMQAARSRVDIYLETSADELTIITEDDGPGLPHHSNAEQLIEPFSTTKPIGQGTGLGLAIVAHIIAAHQGRFTLKNRHEKGCEARISLPRQAPKEV
ncbi:ATP-binding protein [Pseudidiomarina insulisalsae]|uniref:ATP-binding protein n=1 Tax=Pseudidiomarina insulisalsae TaxID=575789 RepID=UPI001F543250|nr:ATP-binding protein [Pseudidiomarina insulisalsae]